jgi:hypothetical protein
MGKLPRVDKWFELHDPRNYPRYENEIHGYNAWLKRPFVVTIEDFPKDALIEQFGKFFFSQGQAPWLMAYAISLKPDAIGLWGIEGLNFHDKQRPELWHFIQICHDRGIEFIIPDNCKLLSPDKTYI